MTEPTEKNGSISDVSAWVLRVGVVASVCVMLIGILFSFVHGHVSVARMESDGFDYRPAAMAQGILAGQGKSIIEAGIYILLLTPIMRVAASMLLFAFEERDWCYTVITFAVLVLVTAGLIWSGQ
jgi:uncharacterized membrane protein